MKKSDIQSALLFTTKVEQLFTSVAASLDKIKHGREYYEQERSKNQFQQKKVHLLGEMTLQLVKKGRCQSVQKLYNDHLRDSDESFLPSLLNELINQNQLVLASALLANTKKMSAEKIINYQVELISQHFKRLANYLIPEYADKIYKAYQQLITYFQQHDQANTLDASLTKNQLIKFARETLDKAFVKIFDQQNPPGSTRKNLYFPVVSDQNPNPNQPGQNWNVHLTQHLGKKWPQLAMQCPDLYNYLFAIQPLGDSNYLWLAQLYKWANIDKHDSDLPEKPEFKGNKINMVDYLPTMIAGIEKILLKLFNQQLTAQQLDELALSTILPINLADYRLLASYFQISCAKPRGLKFQ